MFRSRSGLECSDNVKLTHNYNITCSSELTNLVAAGAVCHSKFSECETFSNQHLDEIQRKKTITEYKITSKNPQNIHKL